MSQARQKVKIATLFKNVSPSGYEYWTGTNGGVRYAVLPSKKTASNGSEMANLVVEEREPKQEAEAAPAPAQPLDDDIPF